MKRIISLLLIVCLAAALTACSSETVLSNGETVNVKRVYQLGHVNTSSDEDQYQNFARAFADKVFELSGGEIAIDIVSDSVLGGERDMLEGMSLGTIDMALITNFSLGSFMTEWEMFDLPYIFEDRNQAYSVLDNDEIMDPIEDKLYDKWHVKVLSYGDGGFRHTLNNKRPINSSADMKGLRLRLPETAIYVDAFKAMGANPTTMAFSETFTGVEQGTVDGLELPISSIYSTGYADICEYLSLTGHFYSPFQMDISGFVWENLTDEEKGWFQEAAKAAMEEERIFVQKKEAEFIEKMEANGLKVNQVSDRESLADAASAIYEKYREEIGSELMDQVMQATGRN
ncbi:MAG: DctP family TRAP transporter solute-binding subunit [Eubacterium sp.]|nr:DctP family TRAP transporter solute-binding subunit [Eubacterium sp.]